MATLHAVIPREYRDSVALMQLSAALAKLPGISQASAVMGTENNLSLLRQAGMNIGGLDIGGLNNDKVSVGPNDLLIVVQGDESALPGALADAKARLSAVGLPAQTGDVRRMAPRSIAMALAENPDFRCRAAC